MIYYYYYYHSTFYVSLSDMLGSGLSKALSIKVIICWLLNRVNGVSHFCNASFGEVTDRFFFLLKQFWDLMAECISHHLSFVYEDEVFLHASPVVDCDAVIRGFDP
jgi:hypothetical protein